MQFDAFSDKMLKQMMRGMGGGKKKRGKGRGGAGVDPLEMVILRF